MKNNKGITLIALIITVILLTILAGVTVFQMGNTYENSNIVQFKSYMKMIQKSVDTILEEGTNYATLGQDLSDENKQKLQEIIAADANNFIETTDVTSTKLRFFDSEDLYEVFDISSINDEIVVNFENREIISLNGVKKDGTMYYVERGL